MSDLKLIERTTLERLYGMASGYVLDFSDRTFQEFVVEATGIDIDIAKYRHFGSSKAKRLRCFWHVEDNYVVGLATQALNSHASELGNVDSSLLAKAESIAERLISSGPVVELSAITALDDRRNFETLAQSLREMIGGGDPDQALDRLHTYMVKFTRTLCDRRGLPYQKDEALHSIFGKYVREVAKEIESEMTRRILKSSISTLDAFNHVRNDQSFAHDNEVLNRAESLLICNYICATIRFLQTIEEDSGPTDECEVGSDDDREIVF